MKFPSEMFGCGKNLRQSSEILNATAPIDPWAWIIDDHELITKDFKCSNHDCDVHLLHFEVLSNFWDDERREST